MPILVKFNNNWADEFDCAGFKIMSEAKWAKMEERYKLPVTYYFGTNEGWEDEVLELTGELISDTTAAVLLSLFPEAKNYGYGVFPPSVEDLDESWDEAD